MQLSGKVGLRSQRRGRIRISNLKGETMTHANQTQPEAQQPNSMVRELNLSELRAVVGGLVVQKTRPDPTVYPVIQNQDK